MFCRQYQSARERTPKKFYRGTCRHDHSCDSYSNSHTPILNRSASSLSPTKNRENQQLNILILFSNTDHSLLSSVTVDPSQDKSEGLIGTKTAAVEDICFEMNLFQEFPNRKLSQEMMLSTVNIIVIIFSNNQELVHQGESDIDFSPSTTFVLSVENQKGILCYIRNYWRGYFNLFLITTDSGSAVEKSMKENLEEDFSNLFLYHSTDSKRDNEVFEALARFYIHCERYQCNKIEKTTSTSSNQSLLNINWKCSGLCGLKNNDLTLRKKKESVITVIRRKLSRYES